MKSYFSFHVLLTLLVWISFFSCSPGESVECIDESDSVVKEFIIEPFYGSLQTYERMTKDTVEIVGQLVHSFYNDRLENIDLFDFPKFLTKNDLNCDDLLLQKEDYKLIVEHPVTSISRGHDVYVTVAYLLVKH